MDERELWTTFQRTGYVVDYLNYKGIHMEKHGECIGEKDIESGSYSDRDDPVCDTDWGI